MTDALALGSLRFVIVDVDCGLPLAERTAAAAALQRQLREDFYPAWGVGGDACVRAATPAAPALENEIQCQLLAKATQDGALGFHDRTKTGQPIIYVFPLLCTSFGDSWTSCLSHELLECAADPFLGRCIQLANGEIWDEEICDRVEQDNYSIDKVLVSNFNYPSCFEPPTQTLGVRYDHLRLSTKPNEVRPGGYAQKFTPGKGWTQVGAMSPYRAVLAGLGLSRGARRSARSDSALGFFSRLIRIIRRAF